MSTTVARQHHRLLGNQYLWVLESGWKLNETASQGHLCLSVIVLISSYSSTRLISIQGTTREQCLIEGEVTS